MEPSPSVLTARSTRSCPHRRRGVRAEVVALDRQGQVKPGWPYRLPFDASTVDIFALILSLDGRLFVGGGYSRMALLALDPDGTLSD